MSMAQIGTFTGQRAPSALRQRVNQHRVFSGKNRVTRDSVSGAARNAIRQRQLRQLANDAKRQVQ